MIARDYPSQMQQSEDARRRQEGRPDKAAMTSEERHAAGLMTVREAAEHERLTTLPHARLAERVRGAMPDDPWARESGSGLSVWHAWESAGHLDKGCDGWSQDGDGGVVCSCGEAVLMPEAADA